MAGMENTDVTEDMADTDATAILEVRRPTEIRATEVMVVTVAMVTVAMVMAVMDMVAMDMAEATATVVVMAMVMDRMESSMKFSLTRKLFTFCNLKTTFNIYLRYGYSS